MRLTISVPADHPDAFQSDAQVSRIIRLNAGDATVDAEIVGCSLFDDPDRGPIVTFDLWLPPESEATVVAYLGHLL